MNRLLCLAVFLVFTFLATVADAFEGPLLIGNEFPLFLHVGSPCLDKATVEDSFSSTLAYSSVYLMKDSPEWSMGLDMETAQMDITIRKNIKDFIELGIRVPVLSFNSGFLDDLLKGYHNLFGLPDYGRHERPENSFLYEVKKDGVTVVEGRNGKIGIGDVKLMLKKPILGDDPAISIAGDLELPTGNAKEGFGNGSVDAGLSLLIDKDLGKFFKSYATFGVVFPGDLKGYRTISLERFLYGGTAIEAAFWKSLSFIGQVFVEESPFPRTDIGPVDRVAVLLSLGARYHLQGNSFEFSFTEDPNTAGAPDISFNFSFKRSF